MLRDVPLYSLDGVPMHTRTVKDPARRALIDPNELRGKRDANAAGAAVSAEHTAE